jgi:Lsr2
MAKTVIVRLTDDIDGGDAEETLYFSLDGKSYEIDVNAANAARVRAAFEPFIAKGRASGGSAGRPRTVRTAAGPSEKTLFSQLSSEEKARFRAWADMATARRISDSRVNSWVEAGKP